MTEAERERAAVVAYLRKCRYVAERCYQNGGYSADDYGQMLALGGAADAIERGDHVADTFAPNPFAKQA